jgi:flavodoxin
MKNKAECPRCREVILDVNKTHHCRPEWWVWCVSSDDEDQCSKVIFATEAKYAAQKWAEIDDINGGRHLSMGGKSAIVCVLPNPCKDTEAPRRFLVTGESVAGTSGDQEVEFCAKMFRVKEIIQDTDVIAEESCTKQGFHMNRPPVEREKTKTSEHKNIQEAFKELKMIRQYCDKVEGILVRIAEGDKEEESEDVYI